MASLSWFVPALIPHSGGILGAWGGKHKDNPHKTMGHDAGQL
jgi:hypothetical protein